ncbi:MAG TPA: hypothetical protein VMS86_14570 [Thermoanaerobaculia bacterium]|nr:hypothetical protein [Thermoanaerobaculia bacterium]
MLGAALALGFAAGAPARVERVRVLLLDYQDRIEHDVLQSFLCVEPCTESTGCPATLRAEGADFWSDDFVVFRPALEGRARMMVEKFRDRRIDLLSMSGHHASGFSGSRGGARFETERLGAELGDVPGLAPFFVRPAMVLLQGCRTDVKSTFTGDPREYILHVIEETQVRRREFDRLLAAVQQIGGVQQAYRTLFPNACILGYSGTQAPGGRFEIYFQVTGWLRALAGLNEGGAGPERRFDPAAGRGSEAAFSALNRRIEGECRGGWPCNLCQVAPGFYGPLAKALARELAADRRRLLERGRDAPRAATLEAALEAGSYYRNTTWSCSQGAPLHQPKWPSPVDESPFARLFAELLLLDLGSFAESERARLREELVHRLGGIELREQDRGGVDAWLVANLGRVEGFIHGPLRGYSTFRQRDFFRFLARAGCAPCFASVFRPEVSALLRQNAASSLEPKAGSRVYRWALEDGDARVRRAAAQRLDASLEPGLYDLVRRDPDPSVREATAEPAAGSSR